MAAHNWLVHRINWENARRYAHVCHGDLLDVGCGEKPYEGLIAPFVRSYTGLDHESTLHERKADAWGTATDLPFDSGSFDTVVMFQTLEHIEEPGLALREAHRVLRPSGSLLVTTPFMWGIHEQPRDFFRYTPYALTYLAEGAGFSDVRVEAVGGYWTTATLRFSYHLLRHRRKWWRKPFVWPLQQLAQYAGLVLERVDHAEGDATGYLMYARKP